MGLNVYERTLKRATRPGGYSGAYGEAGSNTKAVLDAYNERKAKESFQRKQMDLERELAEAANRAKVQSAQISAGPSYRAADVREKLGMREMDLGEEEFEFRKDEAQRAAEQWAEQFGFKQSEADRAAEQWAKQFEFKQSEADRAAEQWAEQFGFQQSKFNKEYQLARDKFDESIRQFGKQMGLKNRELDMMADRFAKELAFKKTQADFGNRRSLLDVVEGDERNKLIDDLLNSL